MIYCLLKARTAPSATNWLDLGLSSLMLGMPSISTRNISTSWLMTSDPRVAVRAVLKVLILLSKGPPNSGALVGCSGIVFGAPTAKSVGKD